MEKRNNIVLEEPATKLLNKLQKAINEVEPAGVYPLIPNEEDEPLFPTAATLAQETLGTCALL